MFSNGALLGNDLFTKHNITLLCGRIEQAKIESFDFLCSFEFIQAMAYFSVRSGSLFTLFHSERKKNKGGRHRALKIASVAEVDTHLGSYVSFLISTKPSMIPGTQQRLEAGLPNK